MWIFFMGIKFREDSHSRVFNFAIILRSRKTQNLRPAKVSSNKVSTFKTHTFNYRPFWGWLGRYRVFSHDVTAAILMSQNNETAAMLVSQPYPVGVGLFSYATTFFCPNKFAWMMATWVKTLYWLELHQITPCLRGRVPVSRATS